MEEIIVVIETNGGEIIGTLMYGIAEIGERAEIKYHDCNGYTHRATGTVVEVL